MDAQAIDLVETAAAVQCDDRCQRLATVANFPTGGLMANWTVVNVTALPPLSGEAVAVVHQCRRKLIKPLATSSGSPQTTDTVYHDQRRRWLRTSPPIRC